MLQYNLDYYSKFLIVRNMGSPAADDKVQMAKMMFAEYWLPRKIILEAGTNFASEMFTQFCRQMKF